MRCIEKVNKATEAIPKTKVRKKISKSIPIPIGQSNEVKDDRPKVLKTCIEPPNSKNSTIRKVIKRKTKTITSPIPIDSTETPLLTVPQKVEGEPVSGCEPVEDKVPDEPITARKSKIIRTIKKRAIMTETENLKTVKLPKSRKRIKDIPLTNKANKSNVTSDLENIKIKKVRREGPNIVRKKKVRISSPIPIKEDVGGGENRGENTTSVLGEIGAGVFHKTHKEEDMGVGLSPKTECLSMRKDIESDIRKKNNSGIKTLQSKEQKTRKEDDTCNLDEAGSDGKRTTLELPSLPKIELEGLPPAEMKERNEMEVKETNGTGAEAEYAREMCEEEEPEDNGVDDTDEKVSLEMSHDTDLVSCLDLGEEMIRDNDSKGLMVLLEQMDEDTKCAVCPDVLYEGDLAISCPCGTHFHPICGISIENCPDCRRSKQYFAKIMSDKKGESRTDFNEKISRNRLFREEDGACRESTIDDNGISDQRLGKMNFASDDKYRERESNDDDLHKTIILMHKDNMNPKEIVKRAGGLTTREVREIIWEYKNRGSKSEK